MAKVTGSIELRQRKNGPKWYARYRLPSGAQRTKLLGPAWTKKRGRPPAGYYTERTAQAALDAILTDARRGEIHDPGDKSGKTFGDAVAEWLLYVETERERAPSTIRDYRNTANGALVSEFGEETPLEQIDQDRIDAYRQRQLIEGKPSRRTVQKRMVLLHGIFKRARQLRWIGENPAENVERVQLKRSGEFNVLTVEQAEAVARAAESDQVAAAIIVAAYTGLRTGELRALRWGDVDFATSNLHVRRNLPVGGGEGLPKSGKVRSVPLMDDAARELDRLSRREHFTGPTDRVFCNDVGRALGEETLRDALYEALTAAGIDRTTFPAGRGFRFHDLRHTYGTLAVQVYPVADVKAYMGHAQLATTELYAHHVPKRNAAGALTEFVNAQKQAAESVP
jgi:integrase